MCCSARLWLLSKYSSIDSNTLNGYLDSDDIYRKNRPSWLWPSQRMKIGIIGAGIIGVTTAYELAADGHDVTVFDEHTSVAEGSSFANAGVVAPGYVTPWAAPGMRGKVIKYLMASHAPVRVRLPLSLAELDWMRRWWGACTPERFAQSRRHMQQLAIYSRTRLHELIAKHGIEIDRAQGYTVLLRSEAEQLLMAPGLAMLRELGMPVQELSAADTRSLEPALNEATPLQGSIHLPNDEVGNCRQFAQALRDHGRALGVVFEHKCMVVHVSIQSNATFSIACKNVETGKTQSHSFDHVVLCAGTGTADLLKPFGIKLPLVKVWGYSVSAPIRESLNAPRSALMDERYKVAISRLGQRVRVAGSADIGGHRDTHAADIPKPALATLYKVLNDWFPGAANLQHAQAWKGARPMLPDGPPVVGATSVKNLWVNAGHGSSGWAMSCGSARVLADQVAGRDPGVDAGGLLISRYGQGTSA
jgi:D-amino-acid dehydrogenase